MSWIELAEFSGGGSKVSDQNVGKLQAREDVIAPRARGRSLGQSLLLVTAKAALLAQLLSKNRPKRTRICAVSHDHLHCQTKNKTSAPFCLPGTPRFAPIVPVVRPKRR